MFKKPFHVKKNVNLRNSDTRRLISRIPGDVSESVDKKAQVAHAKVVTFHDVPINLYLFDKTPLFFDFDEKALLYPTVYFLWRAPSLFPTLVVHEPVLQYLENGADLMLQGVVKNAFPIPAFRKNDAIGIALLTGEGTLQPVAVGAAMMSSEEMIACGFKGKGLQCLHVVKDALWEFGPRGAAPLLDAAVIFPPPPEAYVESAEAPVEAPSAPEAPDAVNAVAEQIAAVAVDEEPAEPENDEPLEHLLFRCFIAALKYRLTKKGTFPMDVGQFYAQCLLKCVPANRRLDMKKTKYKKFATFLDEAVVKHADGAILRIAKKGKGVDLIAEVNWDHPAIRHFELADERIKDEEAPAGPTKGPRITEYYAITESVVPFFNSFAKVSKGMLLQPADTRALITEYVKKENLASGKDVRVDPLLGSLVKTNSPTVDWNTLMQNVQAKMTKTFVLTMPDGRELVKKISMPKLAFKVESRSGNKKVTLLSNLALFGIEAKNLAKEVQVNLATSATTQDGAVNCEGPQLVVQGNQVAYIGELLMGDYGIDKKYIDGLELAPKKKK